MYIDFLDINIKKYILHYKMCKKNNDNPTSTLHQNWYANV